jgi:hypothetical protein
MRKDSDPSVFAVFSISGTLTDNGSWDTFTVAGIVSNGSFSDNDIVKVNFIPKGDKGDTGATGAAGSNGAAGADGTKQWNVAVERAIYFYNGGTTSLGNAMTSTASSGNPVAATSTKLEGRDLRTSTTLNNSAFYEAPSTSTFFLSYKMTSVILCNLNETSGNRCWIGWAANTGATLFGNNSDTPGTTFVGFRYSAGTDSEWKVVTYDGTNLNVFTTGVNVSTTTTQDFRIEWENGGSEVRFYINNTLVKTATVQLPASATAMRFVAGVKNTVGGAGTARQMNFAVIKYLEGIVNP